MQINVFTSLITIKSKILTEMNFMIVNEGLEYANRISNFNIGY